MKQLLVFILFAAMLCWVLFSPIYKHIAIARQAVLQQEVDYMLEVGASGKHGYIDYRMEQQSRERIARFGLDPGKLEYVVATTNGTDGRNSGKPVARGIGISLMISYPYENLFLIDRLIGIEPIREEALMRSFGTKMSEYVSD